MDTNDDELPQYTPDDWYWQVGSDDTRYWSSALGHYVPAFDTGRRLTRIHSAAELNDVLRPYGLALPEPGEADYASAIQAAIDQAAKGRGYADGVALASYSGSSIPQWAAEAATFIAWRDAVWVQSYELFQGVKDGHVPVPTVAAVLETIPAIDWK